MTTTDMIREMIRSKSTATLQDVAAALAVHQQVATDIATLEALASVKNWEDLVLLSQSQAGSVRFFNFRADWSCDSAGYGFRGVVIDIREGFHAGCLGNIPHDLYLSSRVRF